MERTSKADYALLGRVLRCWQTRDRGQGAPIGGGADRGRGGLLLVGADGPRARGAGLHR